MTSGCAAPIELDTLLQYWLDELEPEASDSVDEHLLACGECSAKLAELAALGRGIRDVFHAGRIYAVVTPAFVQHLAARSLRLREYRVPCNGSVNCSVAPQDDVVLSRLEAPLAGVHRLDLVSTRPFGEGEDRVEDVPFDAASGEVVLIPRLAVLRQAPAHRHRVRLISVEAGGDRPLGDYTFVHRPYG
ncbi:hypothetical protein [Reyranella sp.]|jgi:hypothetical protein|uniref:hypothetical protein n=1 Tax=Reyranella sp. TaxID=1929291 RepID=UPI002F92F8BB